MGRETCRKIEIIKPTKEVKENLYTKETNAKEKNEFIKKNIDIFTGLGEFPKKYSITVDPNVKPVANPPRRVPKTIEARLKQALEELEKEGIISKNENPHSWVSSLLTREKPNGSLRICLDPKNLNKAIQRNYYEIPSLETIAEKLNKKNTTHSWI